MDIVNHLSTRERTIAHIRKVKFEQHQPH